MAKRIYIGEVLEAKPIVSRLLGNIESAIEGLFGLTSTGNPEGSATVKQVRQQVDFVVEELGKFRVRPLATEASLQGAFEKAKRKNRK